MALLLYLYWASPSYFVSFYVISGVLVALSNPNAFTIAYVAYRLHMEVLADLYGIACLGEAYLRGLKKILRVEKVRAYRVVFDAILIPDTHLHSHLRLYYLERRLRKGGLRCQCGL